MQCMLKSSDLQPFSLFALFSLFCLLFQELYVPGILYFCCGGVSVVCVLALIWLPETKNSNLSDKLKQRIRSEIWSTEQ